FAEEKRLQTARQSGRDLPLHRAFARWRTLLPRTGNTADPRDPSPPNRRALGIVVGGRRDRAVREWGAAATSSKPGYRLKSSTSLERSGCLTTTLWKWATVSFRE